MVSASPPALLHRCSVAKGFLDLYTCGSGSCHASPSDDARPQKGNKCCDPGTHRAPQTPNTILIFSPLKQSPV
eukprot:5998860-Amphidinium_carterae.1